MKKTTLLNSELSYVIASMGHTDSICVCDAGLPIPDDTHRIDLAVSKSIPSFLEVLDAILSEQVVESILLAGEIKEHNPLLHQEVLKRFECPIHYVSHEAFKKETSSSKAVVRSGECSPYANILLYSGVNF